MKDIATLKTQLGMVASAIGIANKGVMLGPTMSGGVVLRDAWGYWNPLADDGESRRLQVTMGIDLFIEHDRARSVGPSTAVCEVLYDDVSEEVWQGQDRKEAAARLAVFEAAVLVAWRSMDRRREGRGGNG